MTAKEQKRVKPYEARCRKSLAVLQSFLCYAVIITHTALPTSLAASVGGNWNPPPPHIVPPTTNRGQCTVSNLKYVIHSLAKFSSSPQNKLPAKPYICQNTWVATDYPLCGNSYISSSESYESSSSSSSSSIKKSRNEAPGCDSPQQGHKLLSVSELAPSIS